VEVLTIAATYGLPGLVALLLVAVVFWLLVHHSAAAGAQVSFLWGLVSYQKKYPSPKRRRERPVEVIHEPTQTLWRLMSPARHWIDSDLTKYASTYLDSLLAGPYHEPCKLDLSVADYARSEMTYRVARHCPQCEVDVLPKEVGG
jgi:hypothetical protein